MLAPRHSTTILIVGGDPAFNSNLTNSLQIPNRLVLHASSALEAYRILREHEVVFLVIHSVLSDMDGRTFLARLRETPLTAAIPILVLAPKANTAIREKDLVLEADGYLETPCDPELVSAWVRARLRRAHETVKEARRDPLTGLLNRAAFLEYLGNAIESAKKVQEPMALAVIHLDGCREALTECGADVQQDLTRRFALLLSASLRATDTLGRWDTCDFAVVFPGEDQLGGARAVEKLQHAWQRQVFTPPNGKPIHLTLSAGIALVVNSSRLEEAVTEVDRHVFQAVSEGGNRIVTSQVQSPKRNKRVLILLSEEVTARVMRHLLEKDGFDVMHVTTDDQAMIESAQHRFHLIVVDEQLPNDIGFRALEKLRQIPRNSRVPIVMVLSRNSEQSMVRALEMGANDYVTRPFSPYTFMSHMRRLLTRGTPRGGFEAAARRILLVNKDTKALLIAASALQRQGGFRIYLANGIQDGYRRFELDRPDCVVMEWTPRDSAEYGLFKMLLDQALDARMDVIVTLDAESNVETETKTLVERGGRGTILTPFNPLTLGEQVVKLLGLIPGSSHPVNGNHHLNDEIQRILQMEKR